MFGREICLQHLLSCLYPLQKKEKRVIHISRFHKY